MHSQDQYTSINTPYNHNAEMVTLVPQADVGMEDYLLSVRILTPDFPLLPLGTSSRSTFLSFASSRIQSKYSPFIPGHHSIEIFATTRPSSPQ